MTFPVSDAPWILSGFLDFHAAPPFHDAVIAVDPEYVFSVTLGLRPLIGADESPLPDRLPCEQSPAVDRGWRPP